MLSQKHKKNVMGNTEDKVVINSSQKNLHRERHFNSILQNQCDFTDGNERTGTEVKGVAIM